MLLEQNSGSGYTNRTQSNGRVYIETYGCQMNVSDSEVVASILQSNGYSLTSKLDEADVILVNTCSIRDNAEERVWGG